MSLYALLKQSFPNLIEPSNLENCVAQIIAPESTDYEEEQAIGGLLVVVQADTLNDTDNKEQIYLRNFQAQSAYPIADREELLAVIDGVIHDELFWVMEYNVSEDGEIDSWHAVHLLDRDDEIEQQKGVAYQILSWTGKFNRLLI